MRFEILTIVSTSFPSASAVVYQRCSTGGRCGWESCCRCLCLRTFNVNRLLFWQDCDGREICGRPSLAAYSAEADLSSSLLVGVESFFLHLLVHQYSRSYHSPSSIRSTVLQMPQRSRIDWREQPDPERVVSLSCTAMRIVVKC